MPRPELSVLLSTFERPEHLRRSLLSIDLQTGVRDKFELIVTDDGSKDETEHIIRQFALRADFPVHMTTHPHEGFQLATCRNEGARASKAPYLLFLDGDCVLPHDHLAQHLRHQQAGVVMAGDCCRLDRAASERVTDEVIRRGELLPFVPFSERRRLSLKALRAKVYGWLGHPTLPRLTGNNIAIWREDFERVNGFDENFRGWGLEDQNLQFRLSRHGLRFASSLSWTYTCHLWHPPHATFVRNNENTPNRRYVERPGRLSCCRRGLQARPMQKLRFRLLGADPYRSFLPPWLLDADVRSEVRPEVEMAFFPGRGKFSGQAECNVLVVFQPSPYAARLAKQADLVVADHGVSVPFAKRTFPLAQLEEALESIT